MCKKYPEVKPDLEIPKDYKTIVNGYTFNIYNYSIKKACTGANSHGIGYWDKTTSQGALNLYSTEKLASQALLHELEKQFEKICAEITEWYIDGKREKM